MSLSFDLSIVDWEHLLAAAREQPTSSVYDFVPWPEGSASREATGPVSTHRMRRWSATSALASQFDSAYEDLRTGLDVLHRAALDLFFAGIGLWLPLDGWPGAVRDDSDRLRPTEHVRVLAKPRTIVELLTLYRAVPLAAVERAHASAMHGSTHSGAEAATPMHDLGAFRSYSLEWVEALEVAERQQRGLLVRTV